MNDKDKSRRVSRVTRREAGQRAVLEVRGSPQLGRGCLHASIFWGRLALRASDSCACLNEVRSTDRETKTLDMQNPPENGGLATDFSRESRNVAVGKLCGVAVQSFPKIRPEGKRILATGGLTPVPAPSGRVCTTRRRIDVPFSERASHWMPRREKVFGSAPGVPLDRNAKVEGQHTGPITRAFMDVLRALLYAFHNSRDGRCFPSYERIAARANCCRATVYEAIRALETAGVLSWVHRLTKIRVPERDLFGQVVSRWQVIRTSNAYRFHDPQSGALGAAGCESKNPSRPMIQESLSFVPPATPSQTDVLRTDDVLDSVLTSLAKTLGIDLKTAV